MVERICSAAPINKCEKLGWYIVVAYPLRSYIYQHRFNEQQESTYVQDVARKCTAQKRYVLQQPFRYRR